VSLFTLTAFGLAFVPTKMKPSLAAILHNALLPPVRGRVSFLLGVMLTVSLLLVIVSVFLNTFNETMLVLLPPPTHKGYV